MRTHSQLMNPPTDEQPPAPPLPPPSPPLPPPPPPPLPLQPPRSSFSCDRHPVDNNNFTNFCPSCLRERLSIPDQSPTSSSSITEDNVNDYKENEVRVSEKEEETRNMSDLENDILEMEAKIDAIVDNLKSMNDQIDLETHSKKSTIWSTASVWSKKWQQWRSKTKKKKKKTGVDTNDAVSSIAEYGLGRRSCDTRPRFSLDAGRVSVDEPKGLWNVEPGGSTQTREYYLNSSSRRKKGLERSNSMVVDGQNSVSNAKVSPGYVDYNHIHRRLKFHSIGGEKELVGDDGSIKKPRWWNWKGKVWGNHSDKTGEMRSGFNRKLSRSNSSVSWRNTGNNRCQGDEFVSEKDSNHANNGLLRFYLTPLRGSLRSATGPRTGSSKIKLF